MYILITTLVFQSGWEKSVNREVSHKDKVDIIFWFFNFCKLDYEEKSVEDDSSII